MAALAHAARLLAPSLGLAAALLAGMPAWSQHPGASGPPIASQNFDASAKGWRIRGDATTADAQYAASGGDPGGFIFATDEAAGGVWFFEAPADFVAHLRGLSTATLSFSLLSLLSEI